MAFRRLAAALGPFLRRTEPDSPFRLNLKQGLGAFVAIVALGLLLDSTGLPVLIAPFGASTLLLFGRPSSPLAQPINVFGGYMIGGSVAFLSAAFFPGVLWATAVSLGVGLMLMTLLRVTHPPAGAMPLIAFHGEVDFLMLAEGIAVGGSALVIIALIWHRIPPRQAYPSSPRDYAGAIQREGLEDPGGFGS